MRLYTPPQPSEEKLGQPASITSATSINVQAGVPIDYTLTADNASYYEWDDFSDLVEGTNTAFTQDGDIRRLLAVFYQPGERVFTARAGNSHYPSDEITLTVTVENPFSNFAVQFNNNDYTTATADTSNPLYRLDNNSGTPWSISGWAFPSVNNNAEQTLYMFGGATQSNEGRVQVFFNGTLDQLILRYGENSNFVELQTPVLSVIDQQRHHFVITYDGGTTGGAAASAPDYYSRFKIYVNDVEQNLTGVIGNDGFEGEIVPDVFKFGENGNAGNHLRDDFLMDEIAIWDEAISSTVVTEIWNGGIAGDLSLISTEPEHWWRMGDGDTFPTLQDTGTVGTYDMTMTNMTAGDIVTWLPSPTQRGGGPNLDDFDIFDLLRIYNEAQQIGELPSALSAPSATIPAFQSFEYILDVENTAEITWINLPPTVEVDQYDRRRIFGSFVVEEVRVITARIESVFGEFVDFDISVTVTAKFDQYSVNFVNSDYTDATANTSNPLYAVGPSGTAWTQSFWFKSGTSNNGDQTIIFFGGTSAINDGRVRVFLDGGNDDIVFEYGTNNRNVTKVVTGVAPDGEWHHCIITYNGGITGGATGSNPASTYFNAFEILIDGVVQVTTDTLNAQGGTEGWPNGIVTDWFRFGRFGNAGNHMRNDCRLNEVALWPIRVTATAGLADEIYNDGLGGDLSLITTAPDHWWRMGDGDTFPTLSDVGSVGTLPMTMTNQVAGDIIQDAPL